MTDLAQPLPLAGGRRGVAPPEAPAPPPSAGRAGAAGAAGRGADRAGRPALQGRPDLSRAARRAGVEGTVVLDATISADGDVVGGRRSCGACRSASRRPPSGAVRRWKYRPARGRDRARSSPQQDGAASTSRLTLRLTARWALAACYNFSDLMLQVLYEADGRPQVFDLAKDEATIGRSTDNDIVLNDFSVSRRHAYLRRENDAWVIRDNQSTNGVRVNERPVQSARSRDGDQVTIGTFVLRFREEHGAPPAADAGSSTRRRPASARSPSSTSTSAWRRTARAVARDHRRPEARRPRRRLQEQGLRDPRPGRQDADLGRRRRDGARKGHGPDLRVPAGRPRRSCCSRRAGSSKLRISRLKSSRGSTADGSAPYSRTIVDMVVRQKVAVLTSDAQADERFDAGMSIRMQQIRSAMCAPLWNRDSVIGVIHVDSPLHVGTFTEKDLDLLTALANFAAVAIERARLHERVAEEKRIRGRLERYHSPQVVEEIIADVEATGAFKAARTKTVTILFADLVGFTSLVREDGGGASSRALLTRFFTLASDAVFSQDGTIDKFIGDAVMAFFGAPIDQPDHAARAVAAALEDPGGNGGLESSSGRDGGAARSQVRIALNTGEAIVGEIGSRAARRLHGARQRRQRRGAHGGVRRGRRATSSSARRRTRPSSDRFSRRADGPVRAEGPLDRRCRCTRSWASLARGDHGPSATGARVASRF